MTVIESTYKTLRGIKKVVEIPNQKSTQYIIFEHNTPTYFVDLLDLSNESNCMMNSLVLCAKRSMQEALELINKKNHINLSVSKKSFLGLQKKIKTTEIDIDLQPLPEYWLSYSL